MEEFEAIAGETVEVIQTAQKAGLFTLAKQALGLFKSNNNAAEKAEKLNQDTDNAKLAAKLEGAIEDYLAQDRQKLEALKAELESLKSQLQAQGATVTKTNTANASDGSVVIQDASNNQIDVKINKGGRQINQGPGGTYNEHKK